MQRKSADFAEIYDVYAIRVLVDDVSDCYAALGHRPLAVAPDPGPVRRLHRGPQEQPLPVAPHRGHRADGKPLEIQIRTHGMHRSREVGIAAHWRYKEGSKAERDYDAQARLAAPAPRLATRRQRVRRDRVRRGHQARHLPGPGVRVHAEGRHQGPARPARPRSTSRTGSTPTLAIGRSARRSTTASCRWTTG